jgi:hypothetical protein
MVYTYAPALVELGEIAFEIEAKFSQLWHPPQQVVSDESLEWIKTTLQRLQHDCKAVEAHTSLSLVVSFWQTYSSVRPTNSQARDGLICIGNAVKHELGTKVFMFVLPHRIPYWSTQQSLQDPNGRIGTDICQLLAKLEEFPDARYDATEAGNCIAYGLFTASVHHLMRCAEFGLVSVAKTANVPVDKLAQGWDKCIQGIDAEIKRIESTKPSDDWKAQTKRLSDLSAWFTTIRTGWRNPVSHIPRSYSEQVACSMFHAVGTLFDRLNQHGYRQCNMDEFIARFDE